MRPFRKKSEAEALKEEVSSLTRSVEELTILSDLAFAIGASTNPEEIVEKLIERVMRAVKAQQAVVTLLDNEDTDSAKTKLRLVATSAAGTTFHVQDIILGWMYLHKSPLVLNDPRNDERFNRVTWDDSIRTVMCIPMMAKSELTGLLTIYNKKDAAGFTEDDKRLMTIIAAQSATLIENARLAQESIVLAHMREQEKNAYEIQRNLLPDGPPEIEGYDIAGATDPAQTVGGDYYDFMPAVGGRWAVCLGDVSGKGLPASLLMANLQATLRGQTLQDKPVDERISVSNKLLCQSMDDEKFATLFYGELNAEDNHFIFCNAGHENPLLFVGDGTPERLETTGVALGVMEQCKYKQREVSMAPGDILVIYSDGVTDATNKSNEPFGLERLVSIVEENKDTPAAGVIDKVMNAVHEHAGDTPQFDDVTLIVVRRTK